MQVIPTESEVLGPYSELIGNGGEPAGVVEWPIPTTVKEVHYFLGFVVYYRRFVPGFSKVAGPLNSSLQRSGSTKRPVLLGPPPVKLLSMP